MTAIRPLEPGDEGAVRQFLDNHADSSMFLRSNLAAAGLADGADAYQGRWVAAFLGEAIVGITAHFWNGMLAVQAPLAAEALAAAVDGLLPLREIVGMTGPLDQVMRVREALGLTLRPPRFFGREELFGCDLAEMTEPPAAAGLRVRPPRLDELPLLIEWRVAYHIEAYNAEPSDGLLAASSEEITLRHGEAHDFILVDDGDRPLAYCAYNAVLPDRVQIGGVYTPPEQRGHGHARRVVAGSMAEAARRGAVRAVLFTGTGNQPARRAYFSLGFRILGDWGLVLV